MNNYKVFISERSKLMLAFSIEFLSNINIISAKKLENEFFSTVNLLKFYPYRFPVCYINLNNGISYRKIVINKKYIILYYINQNNVFVDLFLDTRKY